MCAGRGRSRQEQQMRAAGQQGSWAAAAQWAPPTPLLHPSRQAAAGGVAPGGPGAAACGERSSAVGEACREESVRAGQLSWQSTGQAAGALMLLLLSGACHPCGQLLWLPSSVPPLVAPGPPTLRRLQARRGGAGGAAQVHLQPGSTHCRLCTCQLPAGTTGAAGRWRGAAGGGGMSGCRPTLSSARRLRAGRPPPFLLPLLPLLPPPLSLTFRKTLRPLACSSRLASPSPSPCCWRATPWCGGGRLEAAPRAQARPCCTVPPAAQLTAIGRPYVHLPLPPGHLRAHPRQHPQGRAQLRVVPGGGRIHVEGGRLCRHVRPPAARCCCCCCRRCCRRCCSCAAVDACSPMLAAAAPRRRYAPGDRPPAPRRTFQSFWSYACERQWRTGAVGCGAGSGGAAWDSLCLSRQRCLPPPACSSTGCPDLSRPPAAGPWPLHPPTPWQPF